MRHAGAPDFSDEDWERLHPLLDAQHRRRWRAIPLWWLGILSGLLLCSNIFWWWMWRQSEQNSNSFRNEWYATKQGLPTAPDTSWEKIVVVQYDTVYKTLVYRTIAAPTASTSESIAANKNSSGSSAGQTADSDNLVNQPIASGSEMAPIEAPVLVTGIENSDEYVDNITDSLPAAIPQEHLFSADERLPSDITAEQTPARKDTLPEADIPATPIKKQPRPPLLIPRKFRIGAGAGIVLPKSAYLSTNSGYLAYVSSEIAFSEQLALTLEAAFGGISFRGTEYDEKLGLPPHSTPGVDYSLQYFETDEGIKPIAQFTLGMRYWLVAQRRLSPYLGLGYAMQWHPSYELKIEYKNQVSGQEKEFSVEVPFNSSPVSLLDLNAGLRYRFFKHWRWQTGLSYQFKLDANQPGIPRFWGLNSAVLYEF